MEAEDRPARVAHPSIAAALEVLAWIEAVSGLILAVAVARDGDLAGAIRAVVVTGILLVAGFHCLLLLALAKVVSDVHAIRVSRVGSAS